MKPKRKIIFNDVSSQYRRSQEHQLKNISFEINEGELNLLAGPSGSGKSTLVLLLNGIIPHHSRAKVTGTIEVFGKNPVKESVLEMSGYIGMLLQDPDSQLATSRVRDEIILTLEFQGKSHDEINIITETLLKQFKIQNLAENDSTRMSGGEKQLVALAAMMASDPNIIILDEPTSNLDPVNTEKILRHVQRFHEQKKTIILIEHKINEVFTYCPPDKILLMNNGKIIAHKTPNMLFKTTLLEDIGLSIPGVARYIEHSGLRNRKEYNLPFSIPEFKKSITSFSKKELSILRESLRPPKRFNFKTEQILLSFNNITFAYRNQFQSSLTNLSFMINKGEFIAIIGNNGSGKSTLVKHIIGLNKPNTGVVIVSDVDTRESTTAQLASKISFLFQNPDNQIFNSSVLDEVKYAPITCKMPKQVAITRAKASIEAVGLAKYIDHNPLKLSMGQKQRVAVASALAMAPEIIVLDEPTTGQDPSSLNGIMDLMRKEYKTKTNLVMVTHDMDLVDQVANRVIVMSDGKVIADGETDQIFMNREILGQSNLKPPLRIEMLAIVNRYLEK
ncbi:MAG: ABC transporter ATP-binding protein [Candidatus Hodarchaeota archaeon]